MTAETVTSEEKQHLVVIGNCMAGARAVEEILERGGGAQFRITMFGDEPYGNYNRIMLSHVLAGEAAEEIYLNPLDWYAENEITLHAGVRVVRVDRFSKKNGSPLSSQSTKPSGKRSPCAARSAGRTSLNSRSLEMIRPALSAS